MNTAEALSSPLSCKPKLILLDVYDTILDMALVKKQVNDLMDSKRGYRIWFEMFMQYCFVDNCTVQFNDFISIAGSTLKMAAKLHNRSIDNDDINFTLNLFRYLPLQENIQEGLSQLIDQNYTLAALTNAPYVMVRERMESTGLASYFDSILSAESVKKYKPCIEVYNWAARKLEVDCSNILFVSSHGWDIAGAVNAGMQTAYIQRPYEMLYPLSPAPNMEITHLEELAHRLHGI